MSNSLEPLQPRLLLHADFNGDFIEDLVYHDTNTGAVIVKFLNASRQVTGQKTVAILGNPDWEIMNVTDMDDDADGDILWRNKANGKLVEWVFDWDTLEGFRSWPTAKPEWEFCGTIEHEGPTAFDDQAMLWRHKTDGRLVMWLMNGRQIGRTVQLPIEKNRNWTVAAISEVRDNAGGSIDTEILWRNVASGQNRIWTIRNGLLTQTKTLRAVGLAYRVAGWQYADETSGGRIVWQHLPTGDVTGWNLDLNYEIVSFFSLPTDPTPGRLLYAGGDTT